MKKKAILCRHFKKYSYFVLIYKDNGSNIYSRIV